MNNQIIAAASASRLNELRERVQRLDPQRFGEGGFYLSSVKEILRGEPANLKVKLPPLTPNSEWAAADTDCLTALRVLSLHGQAAVRSVTHPSIEQFLQELKTRTNGREPLFPLLIDRYSWPLNFALEAESEIREHVLMLLMTRFRAAIEKSSVKAIDADELLLQLTLIAIHACTTTDLRFIDALNYYFELLPPAWQPDAQRAWLLAAYLAFYARGLVVRI